MKTKKINYYVIGGQYYYYCYGGTPTLLGAKRLANKNVEYWDNWQGWHTPKVYKAEDCVEIDTENGHKIIPDPDKRVEAVWEKVI